MSELSEFEKNTTKTIDKDGRTTIKCNKGLWEVSAPNKNQATAEAVRYFMQYHADGEYDDSLSLIEKMQRMRVIDA